MNLDPKEAVKRLEEETGYKFNNPDLLLEAVTHSSYSNEMKINKRKFYERLEFLGDAVLELISSEDLFEKYPEIPEGGLSKKRASMVCEPSLAICARKMNLGKYIYFGKGEDTAGGRERDSILADVTEAILGAIYLDGGLEPARAYVNTKVLGVLRENQLFVDSKTILQELVQKNGQSDALTYEVIEEKGPEHDKNFVVAVKFGDKFLAKGSGHTKKAAQQQAAYEAIQEIKKSNK